MVLSGPRTDRLPQQRRYKPSSQARQARSRSLSGAWIAGVITVVLVCVPLVVLLWSSFTVSKTGLPFGAGSRFS